MSTSTGTSDDDEDNDDGNATAGNTRVVSLAFPCIVNGSKYGDADEENNDKDIINITDKVHLSEMLYFLLYLEIFLVRLNVNRLITEIYMRS